jgi:hypothetical protein
MINTIKGAADPSVRTPATPAVLHNDDRALTLLLSEISEWEEERAELSERETSADDQVDADEWAQSDDAAVELLRHLADAVRTVHDLPKL